MPKTVLVVDDDPFALTLTKDVLVAAGYSIITAANGQLGLDAANAKKPDLILLDVMMPKMDGYTTLNMLKSNPSTKQIPVIMVTAVGYELNKTLAVNMGSVDYITKPIDIKQLRSKVAQFVGA